ncbi:alpha/beta fold hydrolase [Novilysobacter erysipheiresistens]|uniref:Alpha/beta hydrolase n=1 Tax=Novilysobacter erysipheiresistens TaxID=1749332 RepID=A0ABU7YY82_9GAMM
MAVTATARPPAPLRDFVVDTDFGRLAGLRSDAAGAPRVLALHGWLDNAASFVPLQPHLRGIELVAADLSGHGASAHLPLAAGYTVVNAARAMFGLADALGWQRFSLLGHSLGAAVASVMAAAAPQRIERLLAIEALGALAEDEANTALRLQRAFCETRSARKPLRVFPDIASAVRARVQAGGIDEAVARLLVERGLAPVQQDGGESGFAWRSDPRLTRDTAVRLSEPQVRDLLRGIECPTRVIYAEPAQTYFPEPLRQARFDCLRHGELVVLDGGHHLHMEQPAAVAAAIGDFFTASAGPPR